MFYSTEPGGLTTVNCALNPNPDISGIGVRCALYIQAFLTLALKADNSSSMPLDIILMNLGTEVAAVGLILSAYNDVTIDIPHSFMVTYFVSMLSSCRNTPFDFSWEFLQAKKGRQTIPWLWVMDFVFRPIMLAFNSSV